MDGAQQSGNQERLEVGRKIGLEGRDTDILKGKEPLAWVQGRCTGVVNDRGKLII